MTRTQRFEPRFVTSVPAEVERGVLYVSTEFATAIHSCACGCGREVVTPLAPNKWSMTYDGETVSLRPSIGNWNFRCRSHYWIGYAGRVEWARTWSDQEVARSRGPGEARPRERIEGRPASPRAQLLRATRRFVRWILPSRR